MSIDFTICWVVFMRLMLRRCAAPTKMPASLHVSGRISARHQHLDPDARARQLNA
jgi:hypothetical protein